MNKHLKKLASDLRKAGKSYADINREIDVPKSTLSYWLGNKKWSQQIRKELHEKWKEIDTNRLIKINKNRRFITEIKYDGYRKMANTQFKKLVNDPLFLIGLSLYWGEGEKAHNGRVGLVNTDVNILKTIVNFYRRILLVPEEKLRAALFIYQDIDGNRALRFWSRNLKIPRSQFIKTQVLPSRSKLTHKKVKYGVCNAYFSNTELSIKMRQWINLLAQKADLIHYCGGSSVGRTPACQVGGSPVRARSAAQKTKKG